jgi:hypothetical protein
MFEPLADGRRAVCRNRCSSRSLAPDAKGRDVPRLNSTTRDLDLEALIASPVESGDYESAVPEGVFTPAPGEACHPAAGRGCLLAALQGDPEQRSPKSLVPGQPIGTDMMEVEDRGHRRLPTRIRVALRPCGRREACGWPYRSHLGRCSSSAKRRQSSEAMSTGCVWGAVGCSTVRTPAVIPRARSATHSRYSREAGSIGAVCGIGSSAAQRLQNPKVTCVRPRYAIVDARVKGGVSMAL